MKFEQFIESKVYNTPSYKITRDEIMEFAKQYDPQFLHLDETKADKSIFNGIIASGFHTLSIAWSLWISLGVMGEDVIGGVGMDEVRFLKPVFPGDELRAMIEIFKVNPHPIKNDRGYITFSLLVTNQENEGVLKAKIIALIRRS